MSHAALKPILLVIALSLTPVRGLAAASTAPLKVGISADYPPFTLVAKIPEPAVVDLTDPKILTPAAVAEPRGFDIEVARRFAASIGRTVEFIAFDWPDLTASLAGGEFDVAMSGVTLRPERAFAGMFSRPYLVTGAVAVVRREEFDRATQVEWLNASNVRVGVNAGGYLEGVARRHFGNARLIAVDDNTRLPTMLVAHDIDAAVAERFEAVSWERLGLRATPPFTRDLKVYMVAPQSEALLEPLNQWLAKHERDGSLSELRAKWFGKAARLGERQLCIDAVRARIETRLALMPAVAEAKRRSGQMIDDPGQEARVLSHARAEAKRRGLGEAPVANLFRQLIEVAKMIQMQIIASKTAPPSLSASLPAVRQAIATESDQLIAELARCRPHLGGLADAGPLAVVGVGSVQSTRIFRAVAQVGQ